MEKELEWVYIGGGPGDTSPIFHAFEEMDNIHLAGRSDSWQTGQALLNKFHPDLALLDLTGGDEGLNSLARWRAMFPQTFFFCTAAAAQPELIVSAMRYGAREFLLPQAHADEARRAILSVRNLLQGGSDRPSQAKIICCFGVKGGIGTTTLAANLAVSAAQLAGKRVLLMDAKLHLGNAAVFLDLQPRISLLEILENLAGLDVSRLNSTLSRHSSGLLVIAGPEKMEEADHITARAFGEVMDLLRPEFDYIFIDSDDHFDEITIKALDEADTILAIAQLDVSAAFNLRRALALFKRMGYNEEKVALILNNYPQRLSEELQSIEKSINYPVFFRMPQQENGALIESINIGEPLVLSRPRHPFSQQVIRLLKLIQGEPDEAAAPAAKSGGAGLLKRLTRHKE